MECKCPVCGEYKGTAMDLARHMASLPDTEHGEWIESKGFSIVEIVGTSRARGNYRALAELLEKEACVED